MAHLGAFHWLIILIIRGGDGGTRGGGGKERWVVYTELRVREGGTRVKEEGRDGRALGSKGKRNKKDGEAGEGWAVR